jgi:filamentous hemagglutinin family protein
MTRLPHASPGFRRLRLSLLSGLVLLQALLTVSQAQITLDGSLGPPGPLAGPQYRIGAELGQIRGGNLFHSFGAFNVPTGGSATFTGPNTIANIVSRVTGGQPSSIDGLLRSEIAGAHLYLLNPSGVLFGPNATLDVSGSFHVSTADFLRLADGATFFANLGQESLLTVAPPAAFGFLGNTPAAMTIQGSSLTVAEGRALSVVGGDITLVGTGALMADRPTLSAPSGQIHLASVASPGEVGFSRLELAPDLQVDGFTRLGRMSLSQGALVTVGTVGSRHAGAIVGRGGQLTLSSGSRLSATTSGSGEGGRIVVTAPTVSLMEGGRIEAGTNVGSRGHGGAIEVRGGTITLTEGAHISSSTNGPGQAGTVTVAATEAITLAGRGSNISGLSVNSNSRPSGDTSQRGAAGRIVVSAPTVHLEAGGEITAQALSSTSGNGGAIEVRGGTITLTGGAEINGRTEGGGDPHGDRGHRDRGWWEPAVQ